MRSPRYVPTSDPLEVELAMPTRSLGDHDGRDTASSQSDDSSDASLCLCPSICPHRLNRQRSYSMSPRPVQESFPCQLYTPLETYPLSASGLSYHHAAIPVLRDPSPEPGTPPFHLAAVIHPRAPSIGPNIPSRASSVISESQTEPMTPPFVLSSDIPSCALSIVSTVSDDPTAVNPFSSLVSVPSGEHNSLLVQQLDIEIEALRGSIDVLTIKYGRLTALRRSILQGTLLEMN
ncbi:hypothetical protein EST38_g6240 [Candolleomyces aberdarensis]|uniref:Uncharacterized protein n=1 Tax=Candolleomyces aberdarensis TaxID=2316362 RepID=A0A4Q2DK91_9AGAR|nr:hypothetical protein EST38_g6240 [Candolleomyces aberdarensis]